MFNFVDKEHNSYWQWKYDDITYNDIFYRHMHDNIEIHYIKKGNGVFNVNGKQIKIAEECLIIIPPHCFHAFDVNKNEPYERFVFNFPVDYYPNLDLSKLCEEVRIIDSNNFYELKDSFSKIAKCSIDYDESDFIKLLNLYTQIILLQLLNYNFDKEYAHSIDKITNLVLNFIDNHIYDYIDVNLISSSLGVSKSHLQNTFLKSMGIGIKAYVIQRKMDEAQTMLKEGKRAQQIAKELGYKTYSSFYKSYVNTYGHAPKNAKRRK